MQEAGGVALCIVEGACVDDDCAMGGREEVLKGAPVKPVLVRRQHKRPRFHCLCG